MRNVLTLFTGVFALGGASHAAIMPGVVGFQMGLYSAAGEYRWIDDVLSYGPTTTTQGYASPAAPFLSAITVDVSVQDVAPGVRTLTFEVFADDPSGQFFPSGPVAVDGSDVTDFAFAFGMSLDGIFPGAANTAYLDPELIQIIGVEGNLYSSLGVPFTAVDFGLFIEEYGPGVFGGRVYYFALGDDGQPDIGITEQDLSRYRVTITYTIIPAPGGVAAMLACGVLGAFRRR